MDHLLPPSVNSTRPEPVPYLGVVQYDKKGFWGFLNRLGLSDQTLLDHFVREHEPGFARQYSEFINSCLQEWLFFGVLHEFFTLWTYEIGVDIFSKDKFLKTNPGWFEDCHDQRTPNHIYWIIQSRYKTGSRLVWLSDNCCGPP